MKITKIIAIVALAIACASSAFADPSSSPWPWGDPNGPKPCKIHPDGANTLCINLYAIACAQYRNNWHDCANQPDPAGCRTVSWYQYESAIDAIDCTIERSLPMLNAAAIFSRALQPESIELMLSALE